MPNYLLALDQGTTSTRAIIFNESAELIATAQQEIQSFFPKPGWVEQDPEEIWQSVIYCINAVLEKANISAKEITAMGISNQRETTLMWHKSDGSAIYPAIVWQDRRTAARCETLLAHGIESVITQKTGLLLDPYFSATKIEWILDNVPNARALAESEALLFGTVDSFLLWRLTQGKVHATDVTNASRTSLFNIDSLAFDDELLTLFSIPRTILPEVHPNHFEFGVCDKRIFGHEIPILAMAGDQQAALIGHAGFKAGDMKATYGTGCFILLNTGEKQIISTNRLLTTIAFQIEDQLAYGLEGSIFVAGAAVQWLRDAMKFIQHASDSESMAESLNDNQGVYLVPAFTGLGAPYWDPMARGAILGLTRNTGVNHIVRAALESVCYQTKDLLLAMQQDADLIFSDLRTDGGMTANHWLMQFLADILALPVMTNQISETSALGVAMLAGFQAGLFSLSILQNLLQRTEKIYHPKMGEIERTKLYNGWQNAVKQILVK